MIDDMSINVALHFMQTVTIQTFNVIDLTKLSNTMMMEEKRTRDLMPRWSPGLSWTSPSSARLCRLQPRHRAGGQGVSHYWEVGVD